MSDLAADRSVIDGNIIGSLQDFGTSLDVACHVTIPLNVAPHYQKIGKTSAKSDS